MKSRVSEPAIAREFPGWTREIPGCFPGWHGKFPGVSRVDMGISRVATRDFDGGISLGDVHCNYFIFLKNYILAFRWETLLCYSVYEVHLTSIVDR